jgi:hypothetical protein
LISVLSVGVPGHISLSGFVGPSKEEKADAQVKAPAPRQGPTLPDAKRPTREVRVGRGESL